MENGFLKYGGRHRDWGWVTKWRLTTVFPGTGERGCPGEKSQVLSTAWVCREWAEESLESQTEVTVWWPHQQTTRGLFPVASRSCVCPVTLSSVRREMRSKTGIWSQVNRNFLNSIKILSYFLGPRTFSSLLYEHRSLSTCFVTGSRIPTTRLRAGTSDQECFGHAVPHAPHPSTSKVLYHHSWCKGLISHVSSSTVETESLSITGVQSTDVLVIRQ